MIDSGKTSNKDSATRTPEQKISLISIFLTMMKTGLFTFGGGYAMIALLQNEFVIRKKWIQEEEFLNITAIAESTPGPIAINASTYIGYKAGGFPGALLGTLGVCIPSFFIIFLISLIFDSFLSFELVSYAFYGIRVCVVYLILNAGIRMIKHLGKSLLSIALFSVTVICITVFFLLSISFSSVFYILIGGTVSLCVCSINTLIKKSHGNTDARKQEGEKKNDPS